MASYTATRQCFIGGRVVEVGQSIEAPSNPNPDVFVDAASYEPAETAVERVAGTGSQFVVRGEGGRLIKQAVATRLVGRSPGENRY